MLPIVQFLYYIYNINQPRRSIMGKLNGLDYICLILVIIGGINWGLVGFFDFNLVNAIFSKAMFIARIIYAVVGLAALYLIYTGFFKGKS